MFLAKLLPGTSAMPKVKVQQAKTQFSRPARKPRFGAMKGKIVVGDSILEPLPEEELARWEGKAEEPKSPSSRTLSR